MIAAVHSYRQNGFAFFDFGQHPVTEPQINLLRRLAAQSSFTEIVPSESSSSYLKDFTFAQLRHAGTSEPALVLTEIGPIVLGALLSGEMQSFLGEAFGVELPLQCGLGTFNRYEVGDFLEWHRDKRFFQPVGALVLGLQDDYEGGELLVYPDGESNPSRLRLGRGSLTLIRAGIGHEVTKVTSGLRETVTLILGTA